jgi:hypothetical protein
VTCEIDFARIWDSAVLPPASLEGRDPPPASAAMAVPPAIPLPFRTVVLTVGGRELTSLDSASRSRCSSSPARTHSNSALQMGHTCHQFRHVTAAHPKTAEHKHMRHNCMHVNSHPYMISLPACSSSATLSLPQSPLSITCASLALSCLRA